MIARIRQADDDAILQAGKSGDSSYIPALETQAQGRTTDRRVIDAKMALAKLGVAKYLDETIAELTTTNSALFETNRKFYQNYGGSEYWTMRQARLKTQEQAIEKLAYIRNPSTIKTLAAFLYSTENLNREIPRQGDELFGTPAGMAIMALRQMVDNPPKVPVGFTLEQDVQAWQQWWEQNKDKYP